LGAHVQMWSGVHREVLLHNGLSSFSWVCAGTKAALVFSFVTGLAFFAGAGLGFATFAGAGAGLGFATFAGAGAGLGFATFAGAGAGLGFAGERFVGLGGMVWVWGVFVCTPQSALMQPTHTPPCVLAVSFALLVVVNSL
jgi:hypothetical protein